MTDKRIWPQSKPGTVDPKKAHDTVVAVFSVPAKEATDGKSKTGRKLDGKPEKVVDIVNWEAEADRLKEVASRIAKLSARCLSALEDFLPVNPDSRLRIIADDMHANPEIQEQFEKVDGLGSSETQPEMPGMETRRTMSQLRAADLLEAIVQKRTCGDRVKDRERHLRDAMEKESTIEVVFMDQMGDKHKFVLDELVRIKKVNPEKENG